MKFSELPYTRPDFAALSDQLTQLTEKLRACADADAQMAVYREMDRLSGHVSTMMNLCYIRHAIDTTDAFYEKEQEALDSEFPLLQEKIQQFNDALLESPFRAQLEDESRLGKLLFVNMEMAKKSFSPEIIPLLQEESALTTEYQKLYASARVPFKGQELTIAQLAPYKEDPDRDTRKAALEAEGSFFDEHREEFDSIFDKLVKNRTEQARRLGLPSFVELGALRRQRNCYGPAQIAAFRERVVRDLVPLTMQVKKRQADRLGLADFKFYDNLLAYRDGSARPQGSPEEIMAAGRRMYEELSPDTAEFIDLMMENELFDVLAKKGKAPGGFCTGLDDYGYPFIFSNFNGTSHDVDVLTHEAGHAFADFIARKKVEFADLRWPTMDAAETHSMSMEFLTAPWHHLFFGPLTDKYELSHAEDALTFIPYGCLVDHFQTEVYSHPEMTPEERNQCWAKLEQLYRPYIDFAGLPFYGRGAGWQRQTHIYSSPFYYIDYCMAQLMALQIYALSLQDREGAWKTYMAFVSQAGTRTFVDLAHSVGLQSPLDEDCVRDVCRKAFDWTEKNRVE